MKPRWPPSPPNELRWPSNAGNEAVHAIFPHLPSDPPSSLRPMSFTARALAVSGSADGPSVELCAPNSRADFIQALEILSRKMATETCRFELGDCEIESVQVAYLRCPYDVWREVFGGPQSVEEHSESLPMFPVHVWHYQCVDGRLACVGHQVDDLYGSRWLTFVRLCYF
jgi:hypothetical protein